jgi:hypothetical protein
MRSLYACLGAFTEKAFQSFVPESLYHIGLL